MSWLRALELLVAERGRVLLALLAVVTAIMAVGYLRLQWTNDPEVITLQGSDELDFYRGYLERWGSDELIVIAYAVPDAFEPSALETLRALTDDLLELEQVRWVWSLDTAFTIDTGPFGPYARPLIPDRISADPKTRARALASPFVRDALVARDGATLVLSVQLEGSDLDNSEIEREALLAIDAVLARPAYAGLELHLAGSPVFNRELSSLNQRDNALFTPLTVLLVGLFCFALFRSLLVTGLVLAVVAGVVLWVQGTMGWLGAPMNITTSLLPPLLMVLAVADSIHIGTNYLDRLAENSDRRAALRWTLQEIVPPCFWTSATTALGFASLWLVRIESVRTFASFAVLGVVAAFLLSISLLPALLLRLPLEAAAQHLSRRGSGGRLRLARTRPVLAAALTCAALGFGALHLPQVQVATHDGEFFAPENPLNLAYRFIESRLEGVTPFEIEILAPHEGALRDPSAVQAIASLQDALPRTPELTSGLSFVQLLQRTSPDADLTRADALERALFLLEALAPDDLNAWVAADYRRARISARADAMTSARGAEVLQQVRVLGEELFPQGWQVRATGLVPVFSQMEQYLVEGQLRSYGFAVLTIGFCFLVIFRSLRIALIALATNLVPILIAGGLMGLAQIRLDVVTIMVASVALGIIVDDTIHLTSAYLRGQARGSSAPEAMARAMRIAGRPIVFTSLIIAGGFAVLALSDFQPTAHFGIMVSVTVGTALLADLVILPAGLVHVAPREKPVSAGAVEEVIP